MHGLYLLHTGKTMQTTYGSQKKDLNNNAENMDEQKLATFIQNKKIKKGEDGKFTLIVFNSFQDIHKYLL